MAAFSIFVRVVASGISPGAVAAYDVGSYLFGLARRGARRRDVSRRQRRERVRYRAYARAEAQLAERLREEALRRAIYEAARQSVEASIIPRLKILASRRTGLLADSLTAEFDNNSIFIRMQFYGNFPGTVLGGFSTQQSLAELARHELSLLDLIPEIETGVIFRISRL